MAQGERRDRLQDRRRRGDKPKRGAIKCLIAAVRLPSRAVLTKSRFCLLFRKGAARSYHRVTSRANVLGSNLGDNFYSDYALKNIERK